MENFSFKIKNNDVFGFYFTAKVRVDKDTVYLDNHRFTSKTMAYMMSGLNFVYVFFLYLDDKTEDYYDILHKAELELVKKVGFTEDSYSIFKPGLIVDWKDKAVNDFVEYLVSKNPDAPIKIKNNKVIPELSSFGVLFQSTLTSISCMFCDLLTCKYRRSPLDEKLIEKIYRLENSKASKS